MDIPSWVRVGNKVVYVRESFAPFLENQPIIGEIYTIRKIVIGVDGDVGITLVEIANKERPTPLGIKEPGFRIGRFRPLIRKTLEEDMAIFVPLLKTVKEEEFAE